MSASVPQLKCPYAKILTGLSSPTNMICQITNKNNLLLVLDFKEYGAFIRGC